jgi:hypothetical protein
MSRLHAYHRGAATIVVALGAATAAAAQAPAPSALPPIVRQDPATDHHGFWIGFGLGGGALAIDCGTCGPEPLAPEWSGGRGQGLYVALGGTLRPNLLLGGEISATGKGTGDRTASVGHMGVVAQLYPARGRGLFVRGGLGIGVAELMDEPRGFIGPATLTTFGLTVKGGVGYDFRFGGRFALTPFADAERLIGSGVRQTMGGVAYRGPRAPAAVVLGLAVNWY